MVISVIGIRFCCQLHLRRLGPSPYLQPTRERESESESESDSADTEVKGHISPKVGLIQAMQIQLNNYFGKIVAPSPLIILNTTYKTPYART